ncbi:MAG: TolC family protein [Sulfitobacter sp.]
MDRFKKPDATSVVEPSYQQELSADSVIIQGLAARSSALPAASAFDQVAGGVLAANSRAAESELRSALLRSEAASKNWLPTMGPSVSLNDLGSVVANLVVDQVLFDNGRKKGEREYAIADVEVTAVALAQDTNDRVSQALRLYIDAAEGREKTAMAEHQLKDMGHFEYVMAERVRGGVSDMSDLNILRQKLAEIQADRAANAEATQTAMAELNAMSITPLGDLRGLTDVSVTPQSAQPLAVTLAEAQKIRDVAEAKVERAGLLPGLSAGARIGEGGGAAINLNGGNIGFGTGASLKAIKAASEAAGRRVAQADEDARRALRKLETQVAATKRQAAEAAVLTAQAKQNLDLFQAQYDAGQRQVMDVVGVYETYASQQAAEVTLKHDAARLQVEMARILGVLADGDAI